jgi:hypothetical protein
MENEDRTEGQQDLLDLSLENYGPREHPVSGGNSTEEKSDHIDFRSDEISQKEERQCGKNDTNEPVTIRSLFPEDYTFPPDKTMTLKELSRKLEGIRQILALHNIEFDFIGDLPDRVLYRYLVDEYINRGCVVPSEADGFTMVLDGCNGVCDDCFQKAYCETGRELLLEDEDFGSF